MKKENIDTKNPIKPTSHLSFAFNTHKLPKIHLNNRTKNNSMDEMLTGNLPGYLSLIHCDSVFLFSADKKTKPRIHHVSRTHQNHNKGTNGKGDAPKSCCCLKLLWLLDISTCNHRTNSSPQEKIDQQLESNKEKPDLCETKRLGLCLSLGFRAGGGGRKEGRLRGVYGLVGLGVESHLMRCIYT